MTDFPVSAWTRVINPKPVRRRHELVSSCRELAENWRRTDGRKDPRNDVLSLVMTSHSNDGPAHYGRRRDGETQAKQVNAAFDRGSVFDGLVEDGQILSKERQRT